MQNLLEEEKKIWDLGMDYIAGIDEVGRGPLAGPVLAACVILPKDLYLEGVNDSKKLSPKKRDALFDIITEYAIAIGIGRVSPNRIDEVNILNATHEAMKYALLNCSVKPEHVLIDAITLNNIPVPQTAIIKGDAKSQSIAAASIVAKVTRDREMVKWNKIYPEYGFDRHKGYGTAFHIQAIREHGLCPIHRTTFCTKFI